MMNEGTAKGYETVAELLKRKPEIRYKNGVEPSWSRANAVRMYGESFVGDANICVPLALDNALEEVDSSMDIIEDLYTAANENFKHGYDWTFYRYLELIGGQSHGVHGLSFEFQRELAGNNLAGFLKRKLRPILIEAKSRGHFCVLRAVNSKKGLGHIMYIKLGKKDQSEVYLFDKVHYQSEPKPYYGPLEIVDEPEVNAYFKKNMQDYDALEVVEFSLPTNSAYYRRR